MCSPLILVFFLGTPFAFGIPVMEKFNSHVEVEGALRDDKADLSAMDRITGVNEEMDVEPKLYEGDIVLTDRDEVDLTDEGDIDASLPEKINVKRNARRGRHYLWKTKVIPFEIDSVLLSKGFEPNIQAAIAEFDTHTCITWVPRSTEKNWVRFVHNGGCYSSVGVKYWTTGPQELSLGNGCDNKGIVMHEMMHAAGFWHEQSRPDRNQFVEVMWENIEGGKEHNFNKYSHGQIDQLKRNYDYDSLMHYGTTSFSKNGQPTLLALGDPSKTLGQRNGFSKNDIFELNALYDCSGPSRGWSSWSDFGPCGPASNCKKYRQRFCASNDWANCPGVDSFGVNTEITKCSDEECYAPVDGHWGRWSAWSSCSVTCDKGTHTRTRSCDDPIPTNGGKGCVDVKKQTGACEMRDCSLGPDDCTFEAGGWCHWSQDKDDTAPLDWNRHTGSTSSSSTGPTGDHTSGSGNYIFFESSSPVKTGQNARVLSKVFPSTSGRCMSFWFTMFGDGMGSLNVYLRDASSTRKLWGLDGNQGESWKNGKVDISSSSSYRIIVEGVKGADFRSDIAVDDITFTESSCSGGVPTTEVPTTEAPTTEAPTTKVPTTEAPTTEVPTTEAPTTKVPTTEAPTTKVPTTEAPTTEVPTTEAPTTKVPTTEVPTTKVPTTEAPTTKVPTTEAPTTEAPTTEAPTTEASTTEVPTTEAPTTEAPTTKIPTTQAPTTEAPTTEIPTTEAPTTEIPTTQAPTTEYPTVIPTTAPSEPTYDFCDFGEPSTAFTYCTWISDPNNPESPDGYRFHWWSQTGRTPSSGTGPSSDHSADGKGYYIYLETSKPYQAGYKGRLESSKQYQATPEKCLDFWYNMYGHTVASLKVLKDDGTTLWTKTGNQGRQWLQAKVDIDSKTPFKIIFEGVRGDSYTGDIALDDILVTDGCCSQTAG